MEERVLLKTERIALKGNTLFSLRLLQFVKSLETTIGNRFIGERPQSFTWL